jgi:hypothetical protein
MKIEWTSAESQMDEVKDKIIRLMLTFRRCLQKNNIFPAIVFGKIILKFAFIISTET